MLALAHVRVHVECIGNAVLEFYLGLGFGKKDAPVKFKLISLLSNSDWDEGRGGARGCGAHLLQV